MIINFTYQFLDFIRAKFPSAKDMTVLFGILAVIGFQGMKRLQVPENLGYKPAIVAKVQMQKRVGVSGYLLTATLADGTEVRVGSPYLRADQSVGQKICLPTSATRFAAIPATGLPCAQNAVD